MSFARIENNRMESQDLSVETPEVLRGGTISMNIEEVVLKWAETLKSLLRQNMSAKNINPLFCVCCKPVTRQPGSKVTDRSSGWESQLNQACESQLKYAVESQLNQAGELEVNLEA